MAKLAVLPNFVSSVAIGLLNCNLPIPARHGFIYVMKTAKIILKELVFFARHGLLEEEAKHVHFEIANLGKMQLAILQESWRLP